MGKSRRPETRAKGRTCDGADPCKKIPVQIFPGAERCTAAVGEALPIRT